MANEPDPLEQILVGWCCDFRIRREWELMVEVKDAASFHEDQLIFHHVTHGLPRFTEWSQNPAW